MNSHATTITTQFQNNRKKNRGKPSDLCLPVVVDGAHKLLFIGGLRTPLINLLTNFLHSSRKKLDN